MGYLALQILLLWVTGSVSRAEEYSLDECIDLALRRNTEVRISKTDAEIAESRITQARAQAFPEIGVSGEYRRVDEVETFDVGERTVEAGTLDNYSLEASVSQLLYGGGSVGAGIDAARYSRIQSAWSLRATESRVAREVRRKFYDLLLAEKTVAVRKESVEQLSRVLEQTKAKYKEGLVSEFEVLASRVSLSNERPRLLEANRNYDLAVERFKKFLELPEEAVFEPKGSLEAIKDNVNTNVGGFNAAESRPDIRAFQAVVDLRKQDVRAAEGELRPRLNARFTYAGANSYGGFSGEDEWEWHWNGVVSLEWNIWDGNLRRAKVSEKKLNLQKAMIQLDEKRDNASLEIRSAEVALEHSAESLKASRGNVQMADRALEIARARYDEGLTTLIELKDSTLSLNEAKLGRAKALRDYLVAVADLRYATGALPVADD
jgi:outer membrane protein TolC